MRAVGRARRRRPRRRGPRRRRSAPPPRPRSIDRGAAELRLEREPGRERQADPLERRAAVGEHRLLREGSEALGDLERAIEVAPRLDDLGDEAPVERLGASTSRPVRIISSARPMPTIRGSRWVPPSISGTPKRRSVKPRRASAVATRRSHQSASSSPPASAQPEIAAIVGFDARSRVNPSGPSGRWSSQSDTVRSRSRRAAVGVLGEERLARSANAFRSAPAQNASGPSPVSTSAARLVVGLEAVKAVEELGRGLVVDRVAPLGPGDRQHGGRAAALVARARHCVTLRDRASGVHRARPDAEAEKKARGVAAGHGFERERRTWRELLRDAGGARARPARVPCGCRAASGSARRRSRSARRTPSPRRRSRSRPCRRCARRCRPRRRRIAAGRGASNAIRVAVDRENCAAGAIHGRNSIARR